MFSRRLVSRNSTVTRLDRNLQLVMSKVQGFIIVHQLLSIIIIIITTTIITHLLRHILTVPPFQLEPLQKTNKYQHLQNNYIFVLLACEVMGSWSSVSVEFLDSLSEKITLVTGDTNAKPHLYQRISIALQRGNAACVQCCFCNEDDTLK